MNSISGHIGDEKTALFIITPQADRTYSFLASMLYSQLFETLYFKGEQQKANGGSEALKIPVRCLMDEFANIGEITEFSSTFPRCVSIIYQLQSFCRIYPKSSPCIKMIWKYFYGKLQHLYFLRYTRAKIH